VRERRATDNSDAEGVEGDAGRRKKSRPGRRGRPDARALAAVSESESAHGSAAPRGESRGAASPLRARQGAANVPHAPGGVDGASQGGKQQPHAARSASSPVAGRFEHRGAFGALLCASETDQTDAEADAAPTATDEASDAVPQAAAKVSSGDRGGKGDGGGGGAVPAAAEAGTSRGGDGTLKKGAPAAPPPPTFEPEPEVVHAQRARQERIMNHESLITHRCGASSAPG